MTSNGRLSSWYRGRLPPGAQTPLELLMIQATSFCNIDCAYCYLPLRNDKSRFDLDLLPLLVSKLHDAGLLGPQLSVAWHAGEPLVLPVAYYERAHEILIGCLPAGVQLRHNFQTNAMLVSDDYCRFFKRVGVNLGVSIDGPERLHDARRTTRDGKGTFVRAMAGYERLRKHGLQPTAIAVLSDASLELADELYAFFKSLAVREVGFNIDEVEGTNSQSSLSGPGTYQRMQGFFRRMLELVLADPQPLRIREIERAKNAVAASVIMDDCGSTESNPLSIISVDTSGKIATFSPELLQTPEDTSKYTIGDLQMIDFSQVYFLRNFTEQNSAIQRGVEACRASCPYFACCGGGSPANKLAENGRFDSTETMHCRLTRQALADVMQIYFIDVLQKRRLRRLHRPPSATPSQPFKVSAGSPRVSGKISVPGSKRPEEH